VTGIARWPAVTDNAIRNQLSPTSMCWWQLPPNGQRSSSGNASESSARPGACASTCHGIPNATPWIAWSPRLGGSWYACPWNSNLPRRIRPAHGTIG
jgi:hypothetical protein